MMVRLKIAARILAHMIRALVQEGPSHDRGLYYRAVEELFDLVNSEATPTSRTSFFVTMFELYNEQVGNLIPTVCLLEL